MFARARGDALVPPPDPHDPKIIAAKRRRRRRRAIIGGVVALVIVGVVGTYIPVTLQAPLASATVAVTKPVIATPAPASVALALPAVGASAVSVMGATGFDGTVGTNGILASSGSAGPLPIASISKLITALVILQAKPITGAAAGPTITFTAADAALYDKYYVLGATVQPLKAGSTMSERDALKLMLEVSACNYAEATSTWAFGSQANFLKATRTWLTANHMTGTTIDEPTGLDARNRSTTADLISIGKLALASPVLAAIVASPSLDVPTFGALPNTNVLLGEDGINGIKTGTLDQAGACLLFSAVADVGAAAPITVVGVVLGGVDHDSVNTAVLALLSSIKKGFTDVPLVTKGQDLGTYTTAWNDDAHIVAGATASVLTWSDTPITSTMVTKMITTGADGSKIGTVTFVAGKSTVTVPLVLKGSIAAPDAWWRLSHPIDLLGK
jgi:D-alanyl-D-alanine carboxypeptidase (penicillin-binding protein 5/6)